MMPRLHESSVEDTAASHLNSYGVSVASGVEIDHAQERVGGAAVILAARLGRAISKLNPNIPLESATTAAATVLRPPHPTLIENNRHFHGLLTDGVPVEYKDANTGEMRGGRARLI